MTRWLLVSWALLVSGIALAAIGSRDSNYNVSIPGGGPPTFLVDALSATTFGAFSTRKLRSAYAGNALQVKRSSDLTTSNIGFSSNNLDTTTLHSFVTTNTGTMSIWNDQSGNGFDAPARSTSTGDQPVLINAGSDQTINSRICPIFGQATGTEFMQWMPTAHGQNLTLAMLVQLTTTSPSSSSAKWHDGTTGQRVLIGQEGTGAYEMYAGTDQTGGSLTTTTHTVIGLFAGASSQLLVDGTAVISANVGAGGFDGTSMYNLGAGGGSNAIPSFICEFLAMNGSISGTDQATIRTSWQSYWGAP